MTVPVAPTRDVGWLVRRWATVAPDRRFLTWAPFDQPSATWTRAEFARDVAALATAFRARGVRPGDPVALVLTNHPDFLLAWTAATSMGAVAVCLNPGSSVDELRYALGHSGSIAAVASADRADDVGTAMPDLRFLAVSGSSGDDAVATLLDTEPDQGGRLVAADAPASIQYTSGTTARPKGVVWTQANCLWAGQVGTAHQGLGPADVNLLHLPLFHTNGLSYSFLSSLWSGGEVVLMPKFSASRFWDVSVRHRATWTSVVSFCLRALADREVPDAHAYRGWGSSSCLDPAPVTGGVPVVGWFGMTETVSHPVVGGLLHRDRPGSMGRPAPEYEVAVLDDDGAPVEPGATGALHVRGRRGVSLFLEYLHDPEATARAFTPDGWLVTGDRARLEDDGTLSFVERDKDVLKVGGENVGAPEIERALLAVPGVQEAAVVGRPDPMLGEVPVAFVLPRPGAEVTADALERSCADLLTPVKRPREVRIVAALPRSTLDKVAKAELRSLLAAESADG
ncbi:AMP-binding protein [Blastococcus sp. PRF04-17]|uniref:AMP-binding protein n=1 Tax=Blastococcus sp. PRF04-17 TaxID=2933797 RepID=UPI001FF4BCDF|nr:AMP-binding protein [Blastococcus sp. PRF04-17]UOY01765.1 AMP-binding protein [Blastococcus sp. PRF04-17]